MEPYGAESSDELDKIMIEFVDQSYSRFILLILPSIITCFIFASLIHKKSKPTIYCFSIAISVAIYVIGEVALSGFSSTSSILVFFTLMVQAPIVLISLLICSLIEIGVNRLRQR